MIQFNDLRISQDGKYLIIDAQVKELDYYTNVYIDSIQFDVNTTSGTPSSKAVAVYTSESENKKQVSISYDIDTLQDSLFFVYVTTKGTPSSDTPCGMKDTMVIGVTYYQLPIYSLVMKQLNFCGCNPPDDFINFYLQLNAFEYALKVANYTRASELWEKFFKDTPVITTNCGCNG